MNLCPICNKSDIKDVISINKVPIHCNLLWPTKSGALKAPYGKIQLAFCPHCGHLFNRSFDPQQMAYEQDYENSLHYSPRFQSYATGLAASLVERYDLKHKDIVEIGSGQGDFLQMLCDAGDNRGVGFDPSLAVGLAEDSNGSISFVRDFYSEKYAHYPADFICSRHVLEHIAIPSDFLVMLRNVIGDRRKTVVFFEVPNAHYTLKDLGIWDLIYEHFSYFTSHSLQTAFTRGGFQVLALGETFNGQFLTIDAMPAEEKRNSRDPVMLDVLDSIGTEVEAFAENYRQKVEFWKERLAQISETGKRAVVWGAGSKGVTFLNVFPDQDCIDFVVDINPRKVGKFVAGTGQEIVPPQALRQHQPEVVIIMNANYIEEIRSQIEELGVSAEILVA